MTRARAEPRGENEDGMRVSEFLDRVGRLSAAEKRGIIQRLQSRPGPEESEAEPLSSPEIAPRVA